MTFMRFQQLYKNAVSLPPIFNSHLLATQVTNTTTKSSHCSITLVFSFFFASKAVTIQDPLEVGFYHPASERYTTGWLLTAIVRWRMRLTKLTIGHKTESGAYVADGGGACGTGCCEGGGRKPGWVEKYWDPVRSHCPHDCLVTL